MQRLIKCNSVRLFHQFASCRKASFTLQSTDCFTKDHLESHESLFQHLSKHSYVKPRQDFRDGDYDLDVLGNVLMKNWEAEWWKSVDENGSIKILDHELDITSDNEDDEILSHLTPFLKMNEAVATVANVTQESLMDRFLVIAQRQTSNIESYEIQFEQRRFFESFFNKPSRVKVMSHKGHGVLMDQHKVCYEIDELTQSFQEVKGHRMAQNHEGQTIVKSFSLNLKHLFLATILDAYGERNGLRYLKLHPRLAPLKVVVVHECSSEHEHYNDLSQLVGEICDMARSWNITCWNGVEKNMAVADADELGTPYVISLPKNFIETGLLDLRSLSTTIKTEVHISELGNTLLRYLNSSL